MSVEPDILGRIEGMNVFEDVFVFVYHSLLTTNENNDIIHYNNETSAKAEFLFKLIDDFEFIITWVITSSILVYQLAESQKL